MILGLYEMHKKNIIHRDIKTQNIFLIKNLAKLGDFGISKVIKVKFMKGIEKLGFHANFNWNTLFFASRSYRLAPLWH